MNYSGLNASHVAGIMHPLSGYITTVKGRRGHYYITDMEAEGPGGTIPYTGQITEPASGGVWTQSQLCRIARPQLFLPPSHSPYQVSAREDSFAAI